MKIKKINILLISILLIITGCEKKQNEEREEAGNLLYDNVYLTFKENYSVYFPRDGVFFVKGVVLDVSECGYNLEIIEDLKENFVDTSFIFVRGLNNNIVQYQENDTLVLLIEKNEGYYITPIGHSVLKLSNAYVIGYINHWWQWGENEVEIILWKELQEELQELLNLTKTTSHENKNINNRYSSICFSKLLQRKTNPDRQYLDSGKP